MSIADTKVLVEEGLRGAYTSLEGKGATLPTKKTIKNLQATIESVPVGGSDEGSEFVEGTLTRLESSEITSVPMSRFANQSLLSYVSLPNCSSLGNSCFMGCKNLIEVYCPNVTILGNSNTFNGCEALQTINLGNIGRIGYGVFGGCNISFANYPECSTIDKYAFARCYYLSAVSFEVCTLVGVGAFNSCINLTNVYFPRCMNFMGGAFSNCINLKSINLPSAETLYSSCFYGCFNLSNISVPLLKTIYSTCFVGCYNLKSLSLPNCKYIGTSAFYNCVNMSRLDLMSTSMCTLVGVGAFANTLMSKSEYLGYFGSIYVPSSLYSNYITSTNWSYYSNRIVGV